jgi:hypothetical protein
MNPKPGRSPEDQATFERLSAALNAYANAATAGAPPEEQLAALRRAVGQRTWLWVPALAGSGGSSPSRRQSRWRRRTTTNATTTTIPDPINHQHDDDNMER